MHFDWRFSKTSIYKAEFSEVAFTLTSVLFLLLFIRELILFEILQNNVIRDINNIDLTETIKLAILPFKLGDRRYAGEQSDGASKSATVMQFLRLRHEKGRAFTVPPLITNYVKEIARRKYHESRIAAVIRAG